MNSRKICLNRIWREWKYQYGVIRSIADWTIILYLIIPASIAFIFIYRSWWLAIPSWIEPIPLLFFFILIYLLLWQGSFRTYVQEADKIFFVKNTSVFLGMRKFGYAYSVFMQGLHIVIIFLVLLPFLSNHFILSWQQILSILFYFIALKTSIMLVLYYLRKIEQKFKKIVVSLFIFIAFGLFSELIYIFWEKGLFIVVYLCGALMLTVSIIQSLKAIKNISSIEHDIEIEQERKTKNIGLIFSFSYEIEKPAVSKRKRPLLFRRSKRIFKNRSAINGFIELFIKNFIRNLYYLSSFFQIIFATTAAIVVLPPLWMKIVVSIGFLFMMRLWLLLVWNKIMTSNPIGKKYSELPFYFSARKRTVFALIILAAIILCLLVTNGFLLYSYLEVRLAVYQK